MTNSKAIAIQISGECDGTHFHGDGIRNQSAARTYVWPQILVDKVLTGLEHEAIDAFRKDVQEVEYSALVAGTEVPDSALNNLLRKLHNNM